MGITIDGSSVSDITIDGVNVQEVTIDGTIVWQRVTDVTGGDFDETYAPLCDFKAGCVEPIQYGDIYITQDAVDNCSSIDIELDDGHTDSFTSLSTTISHSYTRHGDNHGNSCFDKTDCTSQYTIWMRITYNLSSGGTQQETIYKTIGS